MANPRSLRADVLAGRPVDEEGWRVLLADELGDLTVRLVERVDAQGDYAGRCGLLASLARVVRRPDAAAAMAAPGVLDTLVDKLAAESFWDAERAPALRPSYLWYRDILLRAGPRAVAPVRRLLHGRSLPVMAAPSAAGQPAGSRLAAWLGRLRWREAAFHCGAKLTALSVLEGGATAADEPLLALLALSSREPAPVRFAAALLRHRLGGDHDDVDLGWLALDGLPELPGERALCLAVLGPGLRSALARVSRRNLAISSEAAWLLEALDTEPLPYIGPLTGRREVDEALLTGGDHDDLTAFASPALVEQLFLGVALNGCVTRAARLKLMTALRGEPAARPWLADRRNLERLATAVYECQQTAPPAAAAGLALLLDEALPAGVLRRLLAGLDEALDGARAELLGRLAPSLTSADGPLLERLADSPALRELALQHWLRLAPEAATPVVRAAVLRRELPLPDVLRARADHLDWLLSSLDSPVSPQPAVVCELLRELGEPAVAALAERVATTERPDFPAAVLWELSPAAWRAATAERESRARALSRASAPSAAATRGLSRTGEDDDA